MSQLGDDQLRALAIEVALQRLAHHVAALFTALGQPALADSLYATTPEPGAAEAGSNVVLLHGRTLRADQAARVFNLASDLLRYGPLSPPATDE